jgi:hypothetical protein
MPSTLPCRCSSARRYKTESISYSAHTPVQASNEDLAAQALAL